MADVPEPERDLEAERLLRSAIVLAVADGSDASDHYWETVRQLQQCDPAVVWSLVAPLADDERALRRVVPDVLRYLGGRPQPLMDATLGLLQEMLRRPQEPNVLGAIALAFVDLSHPVAAQLLEPLTRHPNAEVRLSAVHGLLPVARLAVPTLIRLTEDDDRDVRNWATFGLGSQLGEPGDEGFIDSGEIRDALVQRLQDLDQEVRGEAVLGLAIRGDRRALPVLRQELESIPEWGHFIEAAERLADPSLLPALERIRALEDPPFDVSDAIAACRAP